VSRIPRAQRGRVTTRRLVSLIEARLRAARACIADACSAPAVPETLGDVILRDDQRRTTARVLAAIARDGGCLLADDVGQGKTYVALGVARGWTRPLLIVPAALRSMWQVALCRARVECEMVSHESLSRGRVPALEADGIVVDESHHFRSSAARRYEVLARLAAHTPLLLLSATPLQNAARDLAAQLSLFLGARAWTLDASTLARHVVRGSGVAHDVLPVMSPPRWVRTRADDAPVLRAILALPPPARPLDGGDGGVLRTLSLVRAWASSRAALEAMMHRRIQAATAIEQSAAVSLLPTRREVRAWHGAGGDVQLGFALLLAEASVDAAAADALARAVAGERAALGRLAHLLRESPDPDASRVAALRVLRAAHPDERILGFSEFASTIRAYYALMRADAGVGMLTARDARIASGRLARAELLAHFAPRAHATREPVERERITLLLTTDLLSEGVNLQDASVVVHLDLPWNPARLAQRVGRVRRPGGASVVHAYLLAPPADAGLLLDVERRLRRKLARAEQTIGRSLSVMPMLSEPEEQWLVIPNDQCGASAAVLGEVAERVAGWRCFRFRPRDSRPFVAGAAAERRGWLAALDDGRLLASLDGQPPDDAMSVASAVRMCEGAARALPASDARAAWESAQRWLDAEHVARWCGLAGRRTPLEVVLERRIADTVQCASRHVRAEVIALATRLREALLLPRALGAERELEALSGGPNHHGGARWLAAAVDVATRTAARPAQATSRIVALIVFVPIGP
jgi:superfamily II DNA or RNA helicase